MEINSNELKKLFYHCFQSVIGDGLKENDLVFSYPQESKFGDLSLNTALRFNKLLKMNPRELALKLVEKINENGKLKSIFKDIQIAGPGFINLFYSDEAIMQMGQLILNEQKQFGSNHQLKDQSFLIEFVSANPTGPLTIAHARQAAIGDSLHSILKKSGAKVESEYYLNDRGVQISILGRSVFVRYCELLNKDMEFPEDGYQGDYIKDIALKMKDKYQDQLLNLSIEEGGEALKKESYQLILSEIKKDLTDFKVEFDNYYSEQSLEDRGLIDQSIETLTKKGFTFEEEGALWFKTTDFGDDKDRVLIKSNGEKTYLTSDIPYHEEKFKRGFNHLINLLGPDHHGYIARLKASVEALGYKPEQLDVLIVQLVTLYRGKEQLRMSTRKGQFVTLRELIDEVGVDAARYFFNARRTDSHLDFDLELAKKQTPDNPVFYVQYAGARINSVFERAKAKYPDILKNKIDFDVQKMNDNQKKIIAKLFRFPEIIVEAGQLLEPQRITQYLEEIVRDFQSYYSSGDKIISDDYDTTSQKLLFCIIFKQIIENGLDLLGIQIPDRM